MAKVNYNNMKKEQLIELLKEKDDKLSKLNERLVKIEEQLKASSTDASVIQRIDNVERSCFKQEQYSRRECVEFVGLPANIAGQDLENKVIEAFGVAGVKVTSRDFHAIHRLKNEAVVIAKCVNRRDATAILRAKKQLREADEPTKKKLGATGKVYVNESLCPAYRRIFGVCNALFRKKKLSSSYTMNGSIYVSKQEGSEKQVIGHLNDLKKLFPDGEVDSVMTDHLNKSKSK